VTVSGLPKIRENCSELNLRYADSKESGDKRDECKADVAMRHGPLRDLVANSRHSNLQAAALPGIYYRY
jgi:hypothetical protein